MGAQRSAAGPRPNKCLDHVFSPLCDDQRVAAGLNFLRTKKMQKKIQIGEIVERSKKLEALLKALEAEGRGMHELISSVQDKLEPELNKKLRFIATIRNQAIHEPEFDLDSDFERFCASCEEAEQILKKIVFPKKAARKQKEKITPPPAGFNFLFLLPFIPGLNIIYFFFILLLSVLPSAKYITALILYLLSFAVITEGIIKHDETHIILGAGVFAVLYMYNIVIPPRRFSKFRYVPLLNILIVTANIKTEIYWKLFFIANIFIIMSAASGFFIFIRDQLLTGIVLFAAAYLGGIILFLYSGKKKIKN